MKRNNVSVENLEKSLVALRADPGKAHKTNRLEGVWNLEAGQPQFSARVTFEGGRPAHRGGRRRFCSSWGGRLIRGSPVSLSG